MKMKKLTKGQTVEYFTNGNYTKGNVIKLKPLSIETWMGVMRVANKSLLRACYILLLLPIWANAQVNGTIQKTVATGTVRGNFGSSGLDTLPRVTGILLNGGLLSYNSATNKWSAVAPSTISPDTTIYRTVANSRSLAQTQTALNLKANLANPTFTGTLTAPIIALSDNSISSTTNRFNATSGNDTFSQYATHSTIDRAEYVFEAADNGFPWASDGQRWRYSYNASTSGASKDALIIDYSTITTPNAFTAGSLIKSGGTSSQFLKADGSSDGTAYLPLTGGTLTGDNTFVTMASSTGTSQSALRFTSTLGDARVGLDNSAGTVAGGAAYALNLFHSGNYPIQLSTSGLIRYTISGSGAHTIGALAGSGNVIAGADNTGLLSKIAIGSGLSLSGGTLSATGGSAGTVTGSGTSGKLAVWNSASDIGNSPVTVTGSNITVTGTVAGSNLSGTNTGDQTSVTGNAGTATALQTARTIAGISFDGTANIALPASGITNTAAGGISATNVQSALNELDTEKSNLSSPAFTGNPTITGDNNVLTLVSQTGTGQTAVRFTSTVGDVKVGLDNSAGTVAGGAAYALNLLTSGNFPVQTSVNGAIRETISSTAATYTVPVIMPAGSTAVTPSANDNSTKVATTAYVDKFNLASGTYTPTFTGILNITSATASLHQYTRIGDEVTIYGRVSITPTAFAGNSSEIEFTLPIASNMTFVDDLFGIISDGSPSATNTNLNADVTNDRAQISFNAQASSISIIYSLRYIIK